MKIGSGISRSGGFGSKKPAFKQRNSGNFDADEDLTDVEVVPPKRKAAKLPAFGSAKPAATKTDKPFKPSRPVVVEMEEDEPPPKKKLVRKEVFEVEVSDDDDPRDRPELPKRAQALVLSSVLGVQDFEVDSVRPEKPEAFEDELDPETGKDDYEKVRKNNRYLAAPSKLPGDASPDRVRGIVTMFGQRADTILGLLEHEDRTDGALSLIQRTLLQTLVDVLPVIERGVRRSQGRRGIIPLNQTVSQIRELVTDLQSLRDRGHLGATIVERVLRPAFLDIGVQIALAFNAMTLSSKAKMSDEDFKVFNSELQETQRGIATYMQQQYSEVKEGVSSSLS